MKRKKFLAAVVLSLLVFMGVCEAVSEDITGNVVRLHVIANSDTEIDQTIKLQVRDAVLLKMEELAQGKPYDLAFAEQHRKELTDTANQTLRSQGVTYTAQIETGNFAFPTKQYENITFPAGNYDAVRVVLGEGKGQNWWCVMFPPLCFQDSSRGTITVENSKTLKEQTGDAAYCVMTGESVPLKPAVKALELWENVKQNVSKVLWEKH